MGKIEVVSCIIHFSLSVISVIIIILIIIITVELQPQFYEMELVYFLKTSVTKEQGKPLVDVLPLFKHNVTNNNYIVMNDYVNV